MNSRLRMLIILAFIVIILGVVVAVVLPGLSDDPSDSDSNQTDNGGQTTVDQGPTPPPVPTEVLIEIVVAIQPIARGARITPQEQIIGLAPWPEDALPDGALLGQEGLDFVYNERPRARFDLFQGQPILANFVVPSLDQLAAAGSDLASTIPDNRRAISVEIDRLTSVSYGIQPGDRVDIIVSFLFVDLDEEYQTILPNILRFIPIIEGLPVIEQQVRGENRGESIQACYFTVPRECQEFPLVTEPSEDARRPRLSTQITIQNALVVGVGDFPLDGVLFELDPTPVPPEVAQAQEQEADAQAVADGAATLISSVATPTIVTLAVTPQEAVVLAYYNEARIPITFALRSATDTSLQATTAVTLDFIMNEYGIQLPASLPYSFQPAITSVRQLGEEISLSPAQAGTTSP